MKKKDDKEIKKLVRDLLKGIRVPVIEELIDGPELFVYGFEVGEIIVEYGQIIVYVKDVVAPGLSREELLKLLSIPGVFWVHPTEGEFLALVINQDEFLPWVEAVSKKK